MQVVNFLATAFLLAGILVPVGAEPAADWETTLRANLDGMAAQLESTLKPWPVPARTFAAESCGAVADGATLDTMALQKAIDACSAAGGGTVLLSKGDYVSGTIELKSGVMLEIAKGSRLLASAKLADFPARVPVHTTIMDTYYRVTTSLIYAENCDRVGICGEGEIDGRGRSFSGPTTSGPMPGRPFLLRFVECRNVVMDGIHLRNAAAWMEDYLACDNVILQNLHVENQANGNNDGIDMDGCHNAVIRDCFINAEDDGLCFKGASGRTMENILVERCKIYSTCNPLKFGTDSQGGFRNALIRNVDLGSPTADMPSLIRRPSRAGIAWESIDGGDVENLVCTKVHIDHAQAAIFLRLGKRDRVVPGQPKVKSALHHIVFDDITAENCTNIGSIITGVPSARVEDVVLRNVHASVAGKGRIQGPKPEKEAQYPTVAMFGQSPAYGFWIRHAQNIAFFNVTTTPIAPDPRPAFVNGPDTANVTLDGKPLP